MSNRIDVMAIGNAIVDILSFVDPLFLTQNDLKCGSMGLVDEFKSQELARSVMPVMTCAGGSAANAMAGVASLGGKSAFIGRTRNDPLGEEFRRSLNMMGVTFKSVPSLKGAGTANSHIFITPDAERTMRTFLGASTDVTPQDIDEELIAHARILLLETYLFDPPSALETNRLAAELSRKAGNRVALATSDVSCVLQYHEELQRFIPKYVDILVTNRAEAMALTQTSSPEMALIKLRELCPIVVMTCSADGSFIAQGKEAYLLDPAPVETIVDLTGAGDLYAGGFLWALSQGEDLITCGRIATLAAAEVISHIGARPRSQLSGMLKRIYDDPEFIRAYSIP